jgi:hypothetical protein
MTFLHTRDGMALTTTCQLCGMTTRSLSEAAIYATQRGHDAMTCQRRRAETTRAIEAPAAALKWASHDYQATRRNTARRQEKEAS